MEGEGTYLGLADAAEDRAGLNLFLGAFQGDLHHLALEGTRGDAVDGDVLVAWLVESGRVGGWMDELGRWMGR